MLRLMPVRLKWKYANSLLNRALRDFKPEQIEMLAGLVKQYRQGKLKDKPGLCKVATLKEIEEQGWSLNPGRYVGVAERPTEEYDFKEKIIGLNGELEKLNAESHLLEKKISHNIGLILKKG